MEREKEKNTSDEAWENLYNFMDKNEFTCSDFMAVVCTKLLHYEDKHFDTEIMIKGVKFKINIDKD